MILLYKDCISEVNTSQHKVILTSGNHKTLSKNGWHVDVRKNKAHIATSSAKTSPVNLNTHQRVFMACESSWWQKAFEFPFESSQFRIKTGENKGTCRQRFNSPQTSFPDLNPELNNKSVHAGLPKQNSRTLLSIFNTLPLKMCNYFTFNWWQICMNSYDLIRICSLLYYFAKSHTFSYLTNRLTHKIVMLFHEISLTFGKSDFPMLIWEKKVQDEPVY